MKDVSPRLSHKTEANVTSFADKIKGSDLIDQKSPSQKAVTHSATKSLKNQFGPPSRQPSLSKLNLKGTITSERNSYAASKANATKIVGEPVSGKLGEKNSPKTDTKKDSVKGRSLSSSRQMSLHFGKDTDKLRSKPQIEQKSQKPPSSTVTNTKEPPQSTTLNYNILEKRNSKDIPFSESMKSKQSSQMCNNQRLDITPSSSVAGQQDLWGPDISLCFNHQVPIPMPGQARNSKGKKITEPRSEKLREMFNNDDHTDGPSIDKHLNLDQPSYHKLITTNTDFDKKNDNGADFELAKYLLARSKSQSELELDKVPRTPAELKPKLRRENTTPLERDTPGVAGSGRAEKKPKQEKKPMEVSKIIKQVSNSEFDLKLSNLKQKFVGGNKGSQR